MINIKTKKIISFFSLFLIFIFFPSIKPAHADDKCGWQDMYTTTITGYMVMKPSETINNCEDRKLITSGESKCTATKPTYTNKVGEVHEATCCCDPSVSIAKPTTALFTMPDFQVKIPGLTTHLPTITCVTGQECSIPWIGQYIAGIYNYAMAIAGILAALVLMAGGLMWLISAGDVSKITQAKELIIGSISGLIILVASYVLLIQINPDLVNLKGISVTSIARQDITPLPGDPAAFAEKCKPVTTGNCAVANMSGFGAKANEASGICMAESGGNANIHNSITKCTGGEYAVWGLFQFNLSDNTFIDENNKILKCHTAFNKPWTNSKPTCTVTNKTLYDACVKAAINPSLSILNAQKLVTARNWGPWEANSKFCKF